MKVKKALVLLLLLVVLAQTSLADDWPQFRKDAAHSGYTTETVPAKLSLKWVFKSPGGPEPAWRGPDSRLPYDHVYHPVVAGGLLFFGSSFDGKVYALDAATGRQRWTFFTDGPVRFAPAVWKERVFAASDDGYLYCLSAKDGRLLWKKYGGPHEDMLLGNSRMVSRWPVRGGPVILDDIVYFGAGIWPSEGIFVYALDAETGKVLWVNDSSGNLMMEQPHGGNRARSGISAQGYLAAAGDTLLVPTGRSVPAALDRSDGALRYFHLMEQGAGWGGRKGGGPFISIINGLTFVENDLFCMEDGEFLVRGIPGSAVAALPGQIVFAAGNQIKAIDSKNLMTESQTVDKKGKKRKKITLNAPLWSISLPEDITGPAKGVPQGPVFPESVWYYKPITSSLIAAGKTIIVGTNQHEVKTIDIETKSVVTTVQVDGLPLGLAAADGRTYVSTDRGTIYCFSGETTRRPSQIKPKRKRYPYWLNRRYAAAAKEIIDKTQITEGYCLDLGCGEGRLTYELAKRTNLYIYAVEPDPAKAAKARKLLDAAGLYGSRVTVLQRDLSDTGLPNYFANLIVSADTIKDGSKVVPSKEMLRMQRPYGGTICIGGKGRMAVEVRGPLEGAGDWTHQYADAANTLCSVDSLVKGPLSALWFTELGFRMPSRHGRGPAPLCKDGILVVEGVHGLLGVDAYNGRRVWEFALKDVLKAYDEEHLVGTAVTNSNMCLAGDSVYVRSGNRCLRIELATGKKQREYFVPKRTDGSSETWGYIACIDNVLYGSRANTNHVVRQFFGKPPDMTQMLGESEELFALDVNTGEEKWSYKAKYSIRHNAIVIGAGKVYLVDRPLETEDLPDDKQDKKTGNVAEARPANAVLVCLDAVDGKVLWQNEEDIYGTTLALSTKHKILLMGYQYSQRVYQLPSEKGNRLSGFNANDGERIWDANDKYISRPIINDLTVYAQPYAYELLSGRRKEDFLLKDRQPGGCGIVSGSTNMLFYRSGTLGYTNLLNNQGTENYGGVRPGCWVNTIAAGGLLLMPDATDRCSCSYLMKTSIGLQPMQQ